MSIKMIDEVLGRKHDIWCSEINVKKEKQAAKDLLKKFKNPKPKPEPVKETNKVDKIK